MESVKAISLFCFSILNFYILVLPFFFLFHFSLRFLHSFIFTVVFFIFRVFFSSLISMAVILSSSFGCTHVKCIRLEPNKLHFCCCYSLFGFYFNCSKNNNRLEEKLMVQYKVQRILTTFEE